ncbi:MAG: hypothetical protein ACW98X_03605 [Promethearchaeota archaeon]|jgi:uncharacterized protein YoxC
MSLVYRDTITITISYILFWLVIIILIIYPMYELRKTLKRIDNFKKNME